VLKSTALKMARAAKAAASAEEQVFTVDIDCSG